MFLFAALGGALFGCDTNPTSGGLPPFTSAQLSGKDW